MVIVMGWVRKLQEARSDGPRKGKSNFFGQVARSSSQTKQILSVAGRNVAALRLLHDRAFRLLATRREPPATGFTRLLDAALMFTT